MAIPGDGDPGAGRGRSLAEERGLPGGRLSLGGLDTHLLASSLFISSMRPPPPPPLLALLASDLEVPLGLEPPEASSG